MPGAEWGYAALGRESGRVASLIFVACAVGAIAGAGAVFSLVAGNETSIGAAHPLGSAVARAAGHSSAKEPTLAPSQAQSMRTPSVSQEQLPSRVAVIDGSAGTQTSEGAASAPVETAAAPAEHPAAPREPVAKVAAPPAGAANPPSTEAPPAEKKASRKPAYFSRYAWRGGYRDGGRWGGFEERGWRSRHYW